MKILPTYERVRALLDYDPITGAFFWKEHRSSTAQCGAVAGKVRRTNDNLSYLRIQIDGEWHFAHRLAFVWMGKECPPVVDHIDGGGLNNSWANLRNGGFSGNTQNAKRRTDNTSGIKNVSWNKQANRWQVSIRAHGITSRKNFRSLEEATVAAEQMRFKLHGEFARAA